MGKIKKKQKQKQKTDSKIKMIGQGSDKVQNSS
jgi:hypothetical protein